MTQIPLLPGIVTSNKLPFSGCKICVPFVVLMGQAQIYWDMEQYSKVQSILQQSADFCSEHEAWKLNSAHAHFMQGGMMHTSTLHV